MPVLDKELKKLEKDTEISEPKEKNKKVKKVDFSIEEIQEKLAMLYNAIAFLLKIDKDYKPEDFLDESKDIVRLSKKYPFISSALTILDPLFLVLNTAKKVFEMTKLHRKKQEELKAQRRGEHVSNTNP